MNIRLTTLTDAELADVEQTMREAARLFRLLGKFIHAAAAKATAAEANQILLRRADDHRDSLARQLSLVTPGAYDRD